MTYYNVYRLSCPAGETLNWGFDLTIQPNVVHQACAVVLDHDSLVTSNISFLNQSLAPANTPNPTYSQCLQQWFTMGIEAHRLIAYGVTAYQDGPSLSNQGTLTAAQWEVHRRRFFVDGVAADATPTAFSKLVQYQATDLAGYESSQHMPNAYFGESKDGCYMPIRLSHFEEYTSDADIEQFSNSALTGFNIPVPTVATTVGYPPFPAMLPAYCDTPGILGGNVMYRPLNSIWGGISCRNLSPATSFAFYFRQTIECRLTPTSFLTPQLSVSPAYDPVAIASYFRISRELKDAYPADFNDLGKLWEVIKKAATFAANTLGRIPGPVGAIAGMAPMVVEGIDAIGKAVSNTTARRQNPPPAAQAQREQRAIDALPLAPARPVQRKPVQRKQKQARVAQRRN